MHCVVWVCRALGGGRRVADSFLQRGPLASLDEEFHLKLGCYPIFNNFNLVLQQQQTKFAQPALEIEEGNVVGKQE